MTDITPIEKLTIMCEFHKASAKHWAGEVDKLRAELAEANARVAELMGAARDFLDVQNDHRGGYEDAAETLALAIAKAEAAQKGT